MGFSVSAPVSLTLFGQWTVARCWTAAGHLTGLTVIKGGPGGRARNGEKINIKTGISPTLKREWKARRGNTANEIKISRRILREVLAVTWLWSFVLGLELWQCRWVQWRCKVRYLDYNACTYFLRFFSIIFFPRFKKKSTLYFTVFFLASQLPVFSPYILRDFFLQCSLCFGPVGCRQRWLSKHLSAVN